MQFVWVFSEREHLRREIKHKTGSQI